VAEGILNPNQEDAMAGKKATKKLKKGKKVERTKAPTVAVKTISW